MKNKAVILESRPTQKYLAKGDVCVIEKSCALPKSGEVLVRTIYLSIDPSIRLCLGERPLLTPPLKIGSTIPGLGLGIVEDSNDKRIPPGTLVKGMLGWQERSVWPAESLKTLNIDSRIPLVNHLNTLGDPGLTAYFGLIHLANLRRDDTLLVSGAAGGVGLVAGQIGKIKGCRVTAIAGGKKKSDFLLSTLGFDEVIDYKSEFFFDLMNNVHRPSVFFDNVGGVIREHGILTMQPGGRIVLCGEISSGYQDNIGSGIQNSLQIITKSLKLLGLRLDRYFREESEASTQLSNWILSGILKDYSEIVVGLEKCPEAFNKLFDGGNLGKSIVQVSTPEITLKY